MEDHRPGPYLSTPASHPSPSNPSLSEIWMDVGVASGPKESPATASASCANVREREKKSGSQLVFEERFDDRGTSQ